MRHNSSTSAEKENESATLLTAALVLSLFGFLSVIESTGWVTTLTLFILAAVACIGGFVIHYTNRN